jgi:upstream activation factor subunit UAF30
MPRTANLTAAVQNMISSEVHAVLEPYRPMLDRLANLLGAPASGPGRPRKKTKRRGARGGKRVAKLSGRFQVGQKVSYKQGRGVFAATVKSVDAVSGLLVLKRDSDGKVVSRPEYKVGLESGGRAKVAAKPARTRKASPVRKAVRARAKVAAAPKAESTRTEPRRATGFMKPLQPDETIAEIIGSKPLPRGEVTKKVWDYIKTNGLQDTANKRMINPDDKLGRVFGGKKPVSMFDMTKLVAKHLA